MVRAMLKFKNKPWEMFPLHKEMDLFETLHPMTGKVHYFEKEKVYNAGISYREIKESDIGKFGEDD